MSNFFEKHFGYIEKCAVINAREIDGITGRTDFEDNTQEIMLYINERSDQFDPQRGSARTFISMLARTKRRLILRRLCRHKNNIINKAIPFNHA